MAGLTTGEVVDLSLLLTSPTKALLPILCLLPGWHEATEDRLVVSQISGAVTNFIYRCQLSKTGPYVLARIFGGTEGLFERAEEQRIFAGVAKAGLGPQLLLTFGNGRLEEFLLDRTISAAQMRTTQIATCVAAAMACFHFSSLAVSEEADSASKVILWRRMRFWAKSVLELYKPHEHEALGLTGIMDEIDHLKARITASHPPWRGFCHNDLQYGNMLLHSMPALALSLGTTAEISSVQFPASPMSTADADEDELEHMPGDDDSTQRSHANASLLEHSASAKSDAAQHDGETLNSSSTSDESSAGVGAQMACQSGHTNPARAKFSTAAAAAASREVDAAAAPSASTASRGTHGVCSRDTESPFRCAAASSREASTAAEGIHTEAGNEPGSAAEGANGASAEDECGSLDLHRMSRQSLNIGDTAVAARSLSEDDRGAEQDAFERAASVRPGDVVQLEVQAAQPSRASSEVERGRSNHSVSIRLIDYEYAALNPIAYDIANHWCEWGCDYHSPAPHVCNYDLMPSPKQQRRFVRAYVDAVASLRRQHSDHNVPLGILEEATSRAEVEAAIVAAANAYLPASHLYWGLWGLLQARISKIDFDFPSYAAQRLNMFRKLRPG
ncbi:hypothetical protein WJX74_003749 [Apatococcus lobatus]|uniref:Choline kinase n=1 Tax=Apatococcus lobatus TaxID=904363 RepID=A0AAW1QXL2_9CHLO